MLTGICFSVQTISYGTRVVSHYHTDEIAPYAVQSSLILLAPVFYAASIYMMLGRLIRSVNSGHLSIIRPTRLTKLFVAGDVISLTVQGNAAGLTVKTNTRALGEHIITAGLLIQLILFGFFVVAAVMFHVRMHRAAAKKPELRLDVPWRQGLRMLYACSALIIVRSVFRIIEYTMGVDGYLLSNEWPIYVFDALLMWAVQMVFLVWFPDKFQVGRGDGGEGEHELERNVPQTM